MKTDLAVLFEHPNWFAPLFAALERRGVAVEPIGLGEHIFDPASDDLPARVIFNRVAMSSFLRQSEHGIFYAQALLAHWEGNGARVLNGSRALALDSSKARQLSLLARLGYDVPRTSVVHRRDNLVSAAGSFEFPIVVKVNVGGSGAGIARYDTADELARAIADGTVPQSVDGVLLVQDYVPVRNGVIQRVETLGGKYLYAIDVESSGETFDLCPADACVAQPGRPPVRMTAANPAPQIVAAAERIVQAAGIDVGGVELLIDDRDGTPRFYDINALSNFVADPVRVLGWDPYERLVDHIVGAIQETKEH